MKPAWDTLKLLAEPTRLRILAMLLSEEPLPNYKSPGHVSVANLISIGSAKTGRPGYRSEGRRVSTPFSQI